MHQLDEENITFMQLIIVIKLYYLSERMLVDNA